MRHRIESQRFLFDWTSYLSGGSCLTFRWGQLEVKVFFGCDGPYSNRVNWFDYISGFGYKVSGVTWRFVIATWLSRYKVVN